ncbi:hypothetical protein B0H66DRAFT_540202 [Apodospora peruviana]|uniref:Clr5 domain-containing protein n=1 Tax=Apodospora peruviana TaxID=516989 RepID=A0AAE0IPZ1_9PEZI|nr:hypothetical protein B0H66DRAFT_540202 [Apodospora peruviana]
MVFDWDPHRQTCYELYVEQKKSLDEVVEYLRLRYNFQPSRRTFQVKFKEWGFPSKFDPPYKNAALVARVKELWQKNLTQREMLQVLVEEDGFDVDNRRLTRVRAKHRLLLRESEAGYGVKRRLTQKAQRQKSQAGDSVADSDDDDSEEGSEESSGESEEDQDENTYPVAEPERLSAEEMAAIEARREERKRAMEIESNERYATKKRRRRIRGYAGMPADPPGPPRYPSETSLTEAQAILQLDPAAYKLVRQKFQTICEEVGVLKKTIAGPEKWQSLKDQLIRDSVPLRSCMWDKHDIDKKQIAIDVIACDVTKRMRVMSSRLTLAEAKTLLNLNPEEGRDIRAALYHILAEEKFTNKFLEGLDHWAEIKQKWYASSELLTRLSAVERPDAGADPANLRKIKALELIARDAMRRYRSDTFAKGRNVLEDAPSPKQPAAETPASTLRDGINNMTDGYDDDAAQLASLSSAVATPVLATRKRSAAKSQPAARRGMAATLQPQQAQPRPHHTEAGLVPAPSSPPPVGGMEPEAVDLTSQLDSTHMLLPPDHHQYTVPVQGYASAVAQPAPVYQQHQHQHQHQSHPPLQQPTSMAVFFKLHPESALWNVGPRMWISAIGSSRSLDDVRAAAVEKYPGVICYAIEGIIKDGKGGELPLQVSDEMELEAYLQHVASNASVTGQGAAPTFVVHLMGQEFP